MREEINDSAKLNPPADRATDITARKKAEEQLRETSDYLNNLLDYANAPVIVWDATYHVTLFNHAFERLTGRIATSVLGKEVDLLFPSDKREESLASIRRASSGERWETVEIDIQHVDGSIRTLLWNSASLHASDGTTVVATIAQGQDITERNEMQEALVRREDLLNEVQTVSHVGGWEYDIQRRHLTWTDEVYRIHELPPDYDPNNIAQDFHFYLGDDQARIEEAFSRAATAGEPYDLELRFVTAKGNSRWVRTIGQPELEDGQLIRIVGNISDITERKQADEALVSSLSLLKATMESTADGILVVDLAGRITLWNHKFTDMWHIPDEIMSSHADELALNYVLQQMAQPEEFLAKVRELYGQPEASSNDRFDLADGRTFQRYSQPQKIGDNVVGRVWSFSDITERKQAEEALAESEEKLRTLFETMSEGIVYEDHDGKIISANPAAQRLLGLSFDEMQGRTSVDPRWKAIHADGSPFPGETHSLNVAAKTGKPTADEIMGIYNPKSDAYVWLSVNSTPEFLPGQKEPFRAYAVFRDITERRRVEEKLQESYERFHLANLATHDVVWDWNLRTDAIWWSDNFQTVFSYPSEEIEPTIESWSNRIHPEDLDRVDTTIHAAMDSRRQSWSDHYRFRRKDSSYAEIEDRGFIVREANGTPLRMIGAMQDVTDRKKAEEEIRSLNADLDLRVRQRTAELTAANEELVAAHDELQIILDSVPAWVFYKDTENRFVRVNQIFADVMGMTKKQLEGKSLAELYPRDQADAFGADDREVMASGEPKRSIIESVSSPAGNLWVQTDKIPYRDSDGNIIGIIGFTEDITKRKAAEDNLKLRGVQLEAANKELEAFSYSVSHDLRAPLRSIDGFSQAFLEDYGATVPEGGRQDLERVRRATQRMGQLIDDMLLLSRVTRSQMHLQKTDLSAVAAEVAADLARENHQRDVQITVEPGMTAMGDPQLLRIVMANLLGNAWKFTSKREHAHVSVGTMQDPEHGRAFFVRDDGVGFDPRYKSKLFVAFQRLHGQQEFPGTGIGLATVARAVRRHGGEVWAEGEVDRGATFYFTIPDLHLSSSSKEEQP